MDLPTWGTPFNAGAPWGVGWGGGQGQGLPTWIKSPSVVRGISWARDAAPAEHFSPLKIWVEVACAMGSQRVRRDWAHTVQLVPLQSEHTPRCSSHFQWDRMSANVGSHVLRTAGSLAWACGMIMWTSVAQSGPTIAELIHEKETSVVGWHWSFQLPCDSSSRYCYWSTDSIISVQPRPRRRWQKTQTGLVDGMTVCTPVYPKNTIRLAEKN